MAALLMRCPSRGKREGWICPFGWVVERVGGGCFEMLNSPYWGDCAPGPAKDWRWGKTRWKRGNREVGRLWLSAYSWQCGQCRTRVSSVWNGGPPLGLWELSQSWFKKKRFVILESGGKTNSQSWYQGWCIFGRLCTFHENHQMRTCDISRE